MNAVKKQKKRKLTPFGRKVVFASIKKNIELEEVAKRVGTSKQYLNAVLRGDRAGDAYIEKLKKELRIE